MADAVTEAATTVGATDAIAAGGGTLTGDTKVDTTKNGATGAQTTTETTKVDPKAGDAVKAADLELKFPNDWKADEKFIGTFKPLLKELGLDSPKAQKIVDAYVGFAKNAQAEFTKSQSAGLEKMTSDFVEAAKKDAEIGGAKFDESVSLAKKALAKFGTPELAKVLARKTGSGLEDHPEFIRLLARVGKAISEDSTSGSAGGGAAAEKTDPLKLRYPKMHKE